MSVWHIFGCGANEYAHTNSSADPDCYAHAHKHPDANRYTNTYKHANSDEYGNPDTDVYANQYQHAWLDANPLRNTFASRCAGGNPRQRGCACVADCNRCLASRPLNPQSLTCGACHKARPIYVGFLRPVSRAFVF